MTRSYDYESSLVSQFLGNLQKRRVKNMERVFKILIFTGAYMQINLIIFGIAEYYSKRTEFILLFPCWFPFDLSYLPYHCVALAWEYLVIELIGFTIYGAMALVYIIYSHMTSQIELLKFAIENSKNRAYELAKSKKKFKHRDESEEVMKKYYIAGTNQCVQHHLDIIDYYVDAKDISKMIYFVVFVTGLVVCIATGFALISDNTALKIKFVGVCILELALLYVFCWFAEKISEMGESIRWSIYETEWYEMPRECKTSWKLMIERSMKPLGFVTLTGQKVDLENYMSMIQASYSYFNMMLASQQQQ